MNDRLSTGKRLDTRKAVGNYGENLAWQKYAQAGFELLEKQYSCQFGEIDLIVKKGNVIYFVEVRTRTSKRFGLAEESITPQKKQTIFKVSEHYLLKHGGVDQAVQYDVISIYIDREQKKASLKRYPHAF